MRSAPSSSAAPRRCAAVVELIEQAQIGNLLIQFHFGNMQDKLARKSMRLFATEVAPALRRDFRPTCSAKFSGAGRCRARGSGAMTRALDIGGRAVAVTEAGSGEPLVYLHGFADLHGSSSDTLLFHHALAESVRVVAPAHPGCGASEESEEIDTVEDVVFHYLQALDALDLREFHLAGASIGGWIAAEIAVRIPNACAR